LSNNSNEKQFAISFSKYYVKNLILALYQRV
jgi:hypothetical protein